MLTNCEMSDSFSSASAFNEIIARYRKVSRIEQPHQLNGECLLVAHRVF